MTQEDRDRYAHDVDLLKRGLNLRNPDGTVTNVVLGVDILMSDATALMKLLMAKGVITQDEVDKALADGMRNWVTRLEEELSERAGGAVILETDQ